MRKTLPTGTPGTILFLETPTSQQKQGASSAFSGKSTLLSPASISFPDHSAKVISRKEHLSVKTIPLPYILILANRLAPAQIIRMPAVLTYTAHRLP